MIFFTTRFGVGGDLAIAKSKCNLPIHRCMIFCQSYLPEQEEQMLRQLSDRLQEFGANTTAAMDAVCSFHVYRGNECAARSGVSISPIYPNTNANLGRMFR